jgi:hypothetical protein
MPRYINVEGGAKTRRAMTRNERWGKRGKRERKGIAMSIFFATFYSSAVINLNHH